MDPQRRRVKARRRGLDANRKLFQCGFVVDCEWE